MDYARQIPSILLAGGLLLLTPNVVMTAFEAAFNYWSDIKQFAGPEMTATLSQMNRVMATLEELSQKVRNVVDGPASLRPRAGAKG